MAVLLRGSSAATTGAPSALLATTFRRAHGRLISRASRPRRFYVARASAQPLEVCAKESITVPGRLGDCPFTQRVLLTIEEKHLPYDLKLVDLANKPDWLFEINPEGKVPIVKLEDKWVADSDVITQTLEEKYPEPSLATPPDKASAGSKIFSTFIGFLKSKDPSDGTEEALLNELNSFDSYLKDKTGQPVGHWDLGGPADGGGSSRLQSSSVLSVRCTAAALLQMVGFQHLCPQPRNLSLDKWWARYLERVDGQCECCDSFCSGVADVELEVFLTLLPLCQLEDQLERVHLLMVEQFLLLISLWALNYIIWRSLWATTRIGLSQTRFHM